MKKRHSISVRVDILILLAVVAVAGVLITTAYLTNANWMDMHFKERAGQSAQTLSAFLDGNRIGQITALLKTDEYQALRAEAEAAKDDTSIRQFLQEHGELDYISLLLTRMDDYRDNQGATYVYLLDMLGTRPASMYVVDPDEPLWIIGKIADDTAGFERTEANVPVPPTVSHSDFGWLSSCYNPVVDREGTRVACVGIDFDMNEVMAARYAFLWRMLGYAAAVTVAALIVTILIMRKIVVRPISMLSNAVDKFGGQEGKLTKEDVINLPIKTQDEIGNLYQKTRNMEERLVDYMDNLTKVTAEKERIGAELNVATQIQADMLPRIFPPFPEHGEFELYASMDPAKEVGGDFYDFFMVDDTHIALVMADVSGKGVPAALFMVIAKTLIKNKAQTGESPAVVLKDVNTQLCEGNEAELFVTVWLAVIDTTTGKGIAANAGHEHPVIRRGDGSYELVVYRHSPAVATMPGLPFKEHEFELYPGDALFVYTDGVPEATDTNDQLFGADRMLESLNRDRMADPETLLKNVRADIDTFVGEAPQFDDITMLSFQYKGPKEA